MWKKILFIIISIGFVCGAAQAKVKSVEEQRAEWNKWLEQLKEEMADKGISKKTINEAYKEDYFHEIKEVELQDKKQAEFILTSDKYINRLVNQGKVSKAREQYKKLKPKYQKISTEYGVPLNYLVAFWAIETHFGYNKGKYHLIDGLTNLSYKNRRSAFFKKELYNVLQIMDMYDLDGDKMMGSWAGAMGHFQFMPSTFNAYAVDYNGDGRIDIWHSFEDAIASAANYLSSIGWKAGEDWGLEVSLPWNFDYALSGRDTRLEVEKWRKMGVKTADNKKISLPAKEKVSIIVPEGRKGKAYLVRENFRKIMNWNRSENYALAVGMLADYVRTGKKWKPVEQNPAVRVKTDDVLKIQSFVNKLGWFKLDEDGQLGSKTRSAIKKVQAEAKMPQDGYPDYQLLQKINRYNPNIGFAVPVPERKLHK